MPVYELERDGKTFEVEAPNPEAAVSGFRKQFAPTPNVGGLPPDASPIDYARDSMAVAAPPGASRSAPQRPPLGLGASLLEGEHNNMLAARQRTDPSVYDGERPLRKRVGVMLPEVSDFGRVEPGTFITDDKHTARVDPSKHVVLIDPANGQPTVFERNGDAEGTDVTEEPMWKSLGRAVLPGLVTGPLVGPQRVAGAASQGMRGGTIVERLQQQWDDFDAFRRAQVPVFSPAFSSAPTRSAAKGLSETWGIGAPLQSALEDTYRGMSGAATRVADDLSPTMTHDQAGASLQRGLDRFRSDGVREIEPGVLAGFGIDPTAPMQPQQVMSRGAQARAAEAAPIRTDNQGGVAETARGVPVPSARSLDQTIIARRPIEDMDDAQVLALTRAPSGETSFAVRAEALYEHADRQLPRQMRVNDTANPQLLLPVNARDAVNAL